jgi:hypothetical protein
MADNVTITAGTGTTIAADECPAASGVLVQRTKTTWGPDGTANDVDVATGKPMPVQLRAATGEALADTTGLLISTAWPVGTSGFMKKEDVASVDGDAGIAMLAVRKATPANTSGTDGDYEFPQISAGQLWVASVAVDKTLVSERVIAGGSQYETVAVSQTDQILGATGAVGDYLESLICVVATAATSQVQIKDGNGSAILILPNAVGAGVGTYTIPVGLISINATTPGWKVTTAAGVSVIGTGRFT